MTVMTSLEPLGEDEEFLARQKIVREHNSAKIKELLTQLEPHALGYTGPVNPGVVRAYLEGLKQLGQLWRVYDRPEVKPVVDEGEEVRREELRLADQQARVLAELTKLRQIADRRRG